MYVFGSLPRDQRITQNLDRMCHNFSQIFAPIIIAPFTIAYYLYKSVERLDFSTDIVVMEILHVQYILHTLDTG